MGHTKFAPDGNEGLISIQYRRSKVGTIDQLADIIDLSLRIIIIDVKDIMKVMESRLFFIEIGRVVAKILQKITEYYQVSPFFY